MSDCMAASCCSAAQSDKNTTYPIKGRSGAQNEEKSKKTGMTPEEDTPMLESESEDLNIKQLKSVR